MKEKKNGGLNSSSPRRRRRGPTIGQFLCRSILSLIFSFVLSMVILSMFVHPFLPPPPLTTSSKSSPEHLVVVVHGLLGMIYLSFFSFLPLPPLIHDTRHTVIR